MLQLQRPQPMPHRLALDRLPHLSHPDSLAAPKLHRPDLHQARPSLGGPVTPPAEMTSIHGGYNSLLQNGSYNAQRGTDSSLSYGKNGQEASRQAAPKANTTMPAYRNNSVSQCRPVAAPPSPASMYNPHGSNPGESWHAARSSSNNAVAASLQIPSSIKTPQTSMPQLAAEMTCLFWFENSSTLHQALDTRVPPLPIAPLVPDATPTTGFRKWVATILSTTQVTQNVVLLALLFVYRLKTINPGVKGKPGSEYRLLTVALMLGNKFLDDNTYTNKTWADVSGISVQEVHIMEVEFLSNMKYNLFTSAEEWSEWHTTLGKFGSFFDKASRVPLEMPQRTGPAQSLQIPSTLPSPPNSTQASPPYLHNYSPSQSFSNTPTLLPQISSTVVSPIGPLPELNVRPTSRKRSFDDAATEPAPKRTMRSFAHSGEHRENSSAYTASAHPPPILPPSSAMPTTNVTSAPMLPPLPNLSVPHLPPPGGRAMSLVYHPPTTQWSQSSSMPSAPATSMPPMAQPPSAASSRTLSPMPAASATNSPANFPYTTGKQNRPSPSFYLNQRSSPYRPVRGVNTLLVPPPSASLSQPPRLDFEQMHYQPLGRPLNERRVGPLPYMNHDAWPTTNQFNQWPVLPQPNFSR